MQRRKLRLLHDPTQGTGEGKIVLLLKPGSVPCTRDRLTFSGDGCMQKFQLTFVRMRHTIGICRVSGCQAIGCRVI